MQRDVRRASGRSTTSCSRWSDRGVEYLDETLRLNHVVDLFRQQRLREEFERVVVGGYARARIDRVAQELIDWMVDQDLQLWRRRSPSRSKPTTAGECDRGHRANA